MNTREQFLLSNIHRLVRQLKIKKNPDIRHLWKYKSLQFEIKSSKEAALSGPNLIEIGSVIFSATALLFTMISLYINVVSDTIFRFSISKNVNSNAQNIFDAKYLIKESYDDSVIFSIGILLCFGMLVLLVSVWYLYKQIIFTKKLKKYIILEQYLDEYIKIVEESGRELV